MVYNREELIEEAAEAIEKKFESDIYMAQRLYPDIWKRDVAEVALAVFEKACTPTDDELAGELSNFLFSVYEHGSQPNALKEARAILAFLDSRRPVQGEPAQGINLLADLGYDDTDPAVREARASAVQGEPSDAQVLAALNAYGPESATDDLSNYHPINVAAMRAALRAAFATEQVESR